MSTTAWVLKDVLQQIEVLVAQRVRVQTEAAEKKDGKGPHDQPRGSVTDPVKNRALMLGKADVKSGLEMLQRWMQKFVSKDDVGDITDRLMALCNKYVRPQKEQTDTKAAPSTSDKALTVDDKREDTVEFFVFDTLQKLFTAVNQSTPTRDGLSKISEQSFIFCFDHLAHTHTGAVQHAAAMCMGALSAAQLPKVLGLFMTKADAAKKDADLRAFASYQKAVQYLEFSLSTARDTDSIIEYLNSLLVLGKRAERGVLRSEICNTIRAIFSKIFNRNDEKRLYDYNAFLQKGAKVEQLWSLYRQLYELVAKWSKKSKHTIFCYQLMVTMVVLGNEPFYQNKDRDDIFQHLIAGLKKKDLHAACMEGIKQYVHDLPGDFISHDLDAFTAQMKYLTAHLFPKSKNLDADESRLLMELMTEVGRRHLHYLVNEVAVEVLKAKAPYSDAQRAVVLRALGIVASESTENIKSFDYVLGSLLAPYIEETDNPLLLRAGLHCFPNIRHPAAERVTVTAARVGMLTLNPDREIANTAALALQQYVLLSPRSHLIPSLYYFVDLLRAVETLQPEDLLKTCQNINLLFDSVRPIAAKAMMSAANAAPSKSPMKEQPFVDVTAWIALRHHIEALSLVWLCHPEGWVRSEIMRLLAVFCKPEFRAIEANDKAATPYLCDLLIPTGEVKPDVAMYDGIAPNVLEVFKKHYDTFSGILTWAWSTVYSRIGSILKPDTGALSGTLDLRGEWYPLWKNHFQFLCITLRPPPAQLNYQGESIDRYASMAGATSDAQGHAVFSAHDKRPQLAQFRMSHAQLENFLDQTYTVMHYAPVHGGSLASAENPVMEQICQDMSAALAQQHPDNYTLFIRHLRRVVDIKPIVSSPDSKGAAAKKRDAKAEFFFHEHTLDFLSRIYSAMTPEEYYGSPEVVVITLTNLISVWTKEEATEHWNRLRTRARLSIATILERFLSFVDSKFIKDKDQKTLAMANRAMYFHFMAEKGLSLAVGMSDAATASVTSSSSSSSVGSSSGVSAARSALSQLVGRGKEKSTGINLLQTPVQCELDVMVIKALIAMIRLGPINDETLEDNVMETLHTYPIKGKHVDAEVDQALLAFLRMNPHRVRDYIRRSSPEVHIDAIEAAAPPAAPGKPAAPSGRALPTPPPRAAGTPERGSLSKASGDNSSLPVLPVTNPSDAPPSRSGSRDRLQSIVLSPDKRNLVHRDAARTTPSGALRRSVLYLNATVRNFVDQMEHWVGGHKVHPCCMLALSLLHQFSVDEKARLLALELAQALAARDEKNAFDPGFKVNLYSHESPFMYNQSALNYSEALASKPEYYKFTPELLKEIVELNVHTSPSNREMMLRVVLPWIRQFGSLLGKVMDEHKSDKKFVENFARSILSCMFTLTKQCHGSSILTYLLNEMWISLFYHSDPAAVSEVVDFFVCEYMKVSSSRRLQRAEDEALLKMIFVHLTRSSSAPLIVATLMREFRRYYDQVPAMPQEFLRYQSTRKIAPEDLLDSEQSAFNLVTNLVFENGHLFTKYMPLLLQNAAALFYGTPQGRDMLTYVCLALGIYQRDQEVTLEFVIAQLAKWYPKLREAWARTAFVWAVNACDVAVATRSFTIFQKLHQNYIGKVTLERLALSFYLAIVSDQPNKVQELCDIFTLPIGRGEVWDRDGWTLLISMGCSMLYFSEVRYFKLGLQLVSKMLDSDILPNQKTEWVCSLKMWTNDNKQSMDEGVAAALRKGLTLESTLEDTHYVLLRIAQIAGESLLPNNHIMVLLLLTDVLLNGVERLELAEDRIAKSRDALDEARATARAKQMAMRAQQNQALMELLQMYAKGGAKTDTLLRLAQLFQPAVAVGSTAPTPAAVAMAQQPGSPIPPSSPGGMPLSPSYSSTLLADEKSGAAAGAAGAELTPPKDRRRSTMNAPTYKSLHKGGEDLLRSMRSLYSAKNTGAAATHHSGGSSVGSSGQMDSASPGRRYEPQPHTWIREVFQVYLSAFQEQYTFNFVMSFFLEFLKHGDPEWSKLLLLMLGNFLELAVFTPSVQQFEALAEVLVDNYYSVDKEVTQLVEALALFLVQNVERAGATTTFNFVRPRLKQKDRAQRANASHLLDATEEERESHKATAVKRLERHVFPLLEDIAQEHAEQEVDEEVQIQVRQSTSNMYVGLSTNELHQRTYASRLSIEMKDTEALATDDMAHAPDSTAAAFSSLQRQMKLKARIAEEVALEQQEEHHDDDDAEHEEQEGDQEAGAGAGEAHRRLDLSSVGVTAADPDHDIMEEIDHLQRSMAGVTGQSGDISASSSDLSLVAVAGGAAIMEQEPLDSSAAPITPSPAAGSGHPVLPPRPPRPLPPVPAGGPAAPASAEPSGHAEEEEDEGSDDSFGELTSKPQQLESDDD